MTLNEIAARWLGLKYRKSSLGFPKSIWVDGNIFSPLTDRNDLVRVEEKLLREQVSISIFKSIYKGEIMEYYPKQAEGGSGMRNMSFAMTEGQILIGNKTVTRRMGWLFLKPNDLVLPVRKGMGLKKGEKVKVLRNPLLILSVRREPLGRMIDDLDYGFDECEKEGFAGHPLYEWPSEFVKMFCSTHKCKIKDMITRIEFDYT
jgi:hypothetical protein